MRVLLLGGGGREHALAWKLRQSPLLERLWCAPGNPGTASLGQSVALAADDPREVVSAARERGVDLVVVGPEAPLVRGVADALEDAQIAVFGPRQAAARLEGSKAFSKEIMAAAGVPTAAARVFEGDPDGARAFARASSGLVVKADGLAAGKGVIVARTGQEAERAVEQLAVTPAGRVLVLEELLEGPELSVIALCDGERYALLPPAQDHKRVGEGDLGPNTGGMGAYAPAELLAQEQLDEVGRTVIAPTLRELRRRGTPFRGALYAGLMLTPDGVRVLEFNVRLGDPEAQVLMLQLDEDLLPLLDACARGRLSGRPLGWASGASVGIVLASAGYPEAPRTGDPISGLAGPFPDGVVVFHAGTREVDGRVVTAGGRVLTVCARGADVPEARSRALAAVRELSFQGMHFRRDIAAAAPQARPPR